MVTRLLSAALICAILGFAPASVSTAQATSRPTAQFDLSELASLSGVTDPPLVAQHAYVKASNPDVASNFGRSVAISGDTLVVGSPFESTNATGVNGTPTGFTANSGAAYVFVNTSGVWSQQAFLKASNTGEQDNFGVSVAISGDTIVVGAEQEDSSSAANQADNGANDSGAAYVFTRTAGTWSQQAYLKAAVIDVSGADKFGSAVAIDEETIVVGAKFEDSNGTGPTNNSVSASGAAYVFVRNAGVWAQQAFIKASNPDSTNDEFGGIVAVDGDTAVVGARFENSDATTVNGNQADEDADNAGATYVFTRAGTVWTQQAYLKASNAQSGDGFGTSLTLSGDTAIVGAPGEDSSSTGPNGDQAGNGSGGAGAAYVFLRTGSTWAQQAFLKASNTADNQNLGFSVALDGDLALLGAPGESSNSVGINRPDFNQDAVGSGAAYIYRRSGTTWTLTDYLKQSNTDAGDLMGYRTAVSGALLVSTAQGEASDATGVNGDQTDDSLVFAGAAYVFGAPCTTAPFSDVATNSAFCAEIEWMKQSAISTGFMDGTYGPGNSVNRQAMAAFMARFAVATLTPCAAAPFTDVPTSHPFCEEIQWMKDEAISTGFPDGSYGPNLNVSRAAMSAFMSRLAGATPVACTVPPFTDVPISHPFCKEIKWMKDTGISTGFMDGTYGPSLNVTRRAMSAFIYRLNNLINHP